jgi:hypothetical protein
VCLIGDEGFKLSKEWRMRKTMKPDRNGKAIWLLLTLICYATFVCLFVTALAFAFNTDPPHFLQLQG